MPKLSRKKFNPSVRNRPAFAKKKIKLGRQLRRENATNINIKAKRINLIQQTSFIEEENEKNEHESQSTSAAGGRVIANRSLVAMKSLDELAPQLGHYNENLCRDAIIGSVRIRNNIKFKSLKYIGVRQHLKEYPERVRRQLRIIIPSVGALLIREVRTRGIEL
jgi:hypothetical protein